MELQLGQLAMEQAHVDQQLEQTLMERVLERMLMVVRHGVVMVEAPIWRVHHVPRGLPETNVKPNQPAHHHHPKVVPPSGPPGRGTSRYRRVWPGAGQ